MSEQRNRSGQAKHGRSRRTLAAWSLALLLLVVIVGGGALYYAYQELQPPPKSGRMVDIRITSGETTRQIGADLVQSGLIKNALLFRLYVRIEHHGTVFQAGHYRIAEGTGVSELVSILAEGKVVQNAVTVMIPEGFTIKQIADRLAAEKVCSQDAFLKEVQTGTFDNAFLSLLPHNKAIKYRLEGYLFPDTYQFERGESPHAVIQEMLDDFSSHVNNQVLQDIQQSGTNLSDVITEASLIEKEARVDKERPLIASVIQNRLKKPMNLQIDATLEYILGHKDVLTRNDTEVKDPYNTYQNPGLPPGPIASPGMASISAVIHPAHTKYLYYVVKNDGTGEHYFATTYAEQLHDEALSQQNLKLHSH